jgi:glycosyltransferase involved in cell wall biosynthesis
VKAILAGYQSVGLIRGGPLTQILKSAEHLKAHGIETELLDPWRPLGRESADLVHLFSAGIGTVHLAREIRQLGIPLVVSPIIFSRHSPGFIRAGLRASRLLERMGPGLWSDYGIAADICSWAAMVVPNTQAEADLVVGAFGVPRGKIRIVPNGVDARFQGADPELFRREFGLEKFVLNVGHVGPGRKNVLSLIRALAEIDVPAVIIGRITGGPDGEACVREAARHPHIRLLGPLPHDSPLLASAYAACDVFVLPSQFETPGIAALEAGLAGAKIVITDQGGTREYFGELATYVDHRAVESIREGVRKALGQPRDSRLQERIAQNFLWDHVAERLAAVYRELTTAGR